MWNGGYCLLILQELTGMHDTKTSHYFLFPFYFPSICNTTIQLFFEIQFRNIQNDDIKSLNMLKEVLAN